MSRELAPWEVAVHNLAFDRSPGDDAFRALLRGMAMATSAAGMFGMPPPHLRERPTRRLAVRPEQPAAKRLRKAQRAARKARRKGERP